MLLGSSIIKKRGLLDVRDNESNVYLPCVVHFVVLNSPSRHASLILCLFLAQQESPRDPIHTT